MIIFNEEFKSVHIKQMNCTWGLCVPSHHTPGWFEFCAKLVNGIVI